MNAYVRPSTSPSVRPSGSGPLSSLRSSNPDAVWFELKKSGLTEATSCSNASPESKTWRPSVDQIENERDP
ncbi:MAG: hypothetical protein K0R97_3294 [Oerskovia sp.]|nr:hypothetical protein [Oerskovia sp.]